MSSQISIRTKQVHLSEQKVYKEQIPLNEALQSALQKTVAQSLRKELIVRCEALPVVEAKRADLLQAMELLLGTITPKKWRDGKLFLHINCEEMNKEVDAALTSGLKRFIVHFHTNITTTEQWHASNELALSQCTLILDSMDAVLAVNDVRSTGCLFSISLLGKL